MKHGLNTEIHTKTKYKAITGKHYKSMIFTDLGMTVFCYCLFLAATSDLQINRECHGSGLVEIQYPTTIIGKTPCR